MLAGARSLARRYAGELELHARRLALARRRPSVVIFPSNAAWDSASRLRAWELAKPLQALGWRALLVPPQLDLAQRLRLLRLEQPDVILLQQTRHPLNRPQLYRPYPCVLDADDADILDPRYKDEIAASAAASAAVIGGSRFVAGQMARHNPVSHVVWTSTPVPERTRSRPPSARDRLVAWAHSEPLRYEVEQIFVQKVMLEVAARARCKFLLFGTQPDAARAWFQPLRDAGIDCSAVATMPYAQYLATVATAAVGLQPVCIENEFSQGKSFGKLLAYFAGQVPAVATDAVDHPLFFVNRVNGYILPNEPAAWAEAIVALLDDPPLRDRIAEAAWSDFKAKLTTDVFARALDRILRSVIAAERHPRPE